MVHVLCDDKDKQNVLSSPLLLYSKHHCEKSSTKISPADHFVKQLSSGHKKHSLV